MATEDSAEPVIDCAPIRLMRKNKEAQKMLFWRWFARPITVVTVWVMWLRMLLYVIKDL